MILSNLPEETFIWNIAPYLSILDLYPLQDLDESWKNLYKSRIKKISLRELEFVFIESNSQVLDSILDEHSIKLVERDIEMLFIKAEEISNVEMMKNLVRRFGTSAFIRRSESQLGEEKFVLFFDIYLYVVKEFISIRGVTHDYTFLIMDILYSACPKFSYETLLEILRKLKERNLLFEPVFHAIGAYIQSDKGCYLNPSCDRALSYEDIDMDSKSPVGQPSCNRIPSYEDIDMEYEPCASERKNIIRYKEIMVYFLELTKDVIPITQDAIDRISL